MEVQDSSALANWVPEVVWLEVRMAVPRQTWEEQSLCCLPEVLSGAAAAQAMQGWLSAVGGVDG